jgi:6-phosphogluconolactonase/glucosamine-6-phosphate isomerase/deaminase
MLRTKPGAVLALPAGNTPRPVYEELARRHRETGLSFARAMAFTLDEYAGIAADHRASFRRYMNEAFISTSTCRARPRTPPPRPAPISTPNAPGRGAKAPEIEGRLG